MERGRAGVGGTGGATAEPHPVLRTRPRCPRRCSDPERSRGQVSVSTRPERNYIATNGRSVTANHPETAKVVCNARCARNGLGQRYRSAPDRAIPGQSGKATRHQGALRSPRVCPSSACHATCLRPERPSGASRRRCPLDRRRVGVPRRCMAHQASSLALAASPGQGVRQRPLLPALHQGRRPFPQRCPRGFVLRSAAARPLRRTRSAPSPHSVRTLSPSATRPRPKPDHAGEQTSPAG